MTPPMVQRLRDPAAAVQEARVSMRAMAQAHGPEAHGTLLLLAMPCLLPVTGVGTVLGLGMAALAVAMWRGHCAPCLPHRVAEPELPRHWTQRVLVGLASAYTLAGRHARARLRACDAGVHRAGAGVSRWGRSDPGAADVGGGTGCHDRPAADGMGLGQRVVAGLGLRLNENDR